MNVKLMFNGHTVNIYENVSYMTNWPCSILLLNIIKNTFMYFEKGQGCSK